MRNFLTNLFVGALGAGFVAFFIVYLFTDTRQVDRQIIQWNASIFGAP
mgnify:CR=1 FL=1